ncbi:MAG: type I glyceraldehyde-3-phosphate dehydrogenase [Pseudomonadales bacterium]
MKIGINGFGRIGRQVMRIAHAQGLEVGHINDLSDVEVLAHLLRFDSVYGRWGDHAVSAEEGGFDIDGRRVSVSSQSDPEKIPWKDHGVDVVLESTGAFRKREDAAKHLAAGAAKVLISAPGKSQLDGDFVIGVNADDYDPQTHDIISIGSCTTNCLAPVAKVLHEEFHIQHGLINTVHAYTSSQNLVDAPQKSKRLRRARAAATNIIPTTTGAARTIALVMPELEGRLDGMAVRVPVICGSLLDLTCTVEKQVTAESVNDALRRWADGSMKGILQVEDAPIVSGDVIGTEFSAIVSPGDTKVRGEHLVKVLAWYDNEWAFSRRCVDMMERML